jgi:hypothetical protein
LIHCVGEEFEDHPELPADLESSLASWEAETTGRGARFEGGRLRAARRAKTVRIRGGEVLVTDGPFAETKEQVAGYDIVECADLDDALEIASRLATAAIGTIEIRPVAEERSIRLLKPTPPSPRRSRRSGDGSWPG